MAKQDVQVKEVDVIRVYNRKFGEFYVSYSEHMQQFLHTLQEKLESLQQIKQDIKKEREKLDDEIRQARHKYEDTFKPDASETDYNEIRQCRDDFEHLSGSVYHQAKNCGELSHHKMLQATEIAGMIEQRTKKLISSFQTYVERGRQYLDKVEQYIEQYKETNLNT